MSEVKLEVGMLIVSFLKDRPRAVHEARLYAQGNSFANELYVLFHISYLTRNLICAMRLLNFSSVILNTSVFLIRNFGRF